MTFKRYLTDRWKTAALLLFGLATAEIFLLLYPVHIMIRIYTGVIPLLMFCVGNFVEYRSKKAFYEDVQAKVEYLEEKYMIVEMLKRSDFIEEELLQEILRDSNKAMIEKVNEYKCIQQEYKEYIELWIHEIKLPIATSRMIIENNRNTITKSIEEELTEIEGYTEQALYYARSSHANKDYYVTECSIKDIVNEAVKKNKQSLIRNKVRIIIEDIERTVYTDPKWCHFILGQIIENSVKYKKGDQPEIRFSVTERKERVILHIRDNGIGIKAGEVGRVFDKGFTGTNGRIGRKSTGIGLYLCKKLCNKLGIGIEIESEENAGCEVRLVFPKNSFSLLN